MLQICQESLVDPLREGLHRMQAAAAHLKQDRSDSPGTVEDGSGDSGGGGGVAETAGSSVSEGTAVSYAAAGADTAEP